MFAAGEGNGHYVGVLTDYQRAHWRLLKRPIPSTFEQKGGNPLPGLALLPHETVSPSWIRHKNRQTYVYWDKKRCCTILITALNEMRIEHTGHQAVEYWVQLESHPETATFPAGSHFGEVTAVTAPDLVSGLNELLPRLRKTLASPSDDWWEPLDQKLV